MPVAREPRDEMANRERKNLPASGQPAPRENETERLLRLIDRLNGIGIALSRESDDDRLLDRILDGARELTEADGGTLYLKDDRDRLHFTRVQNDSLGLRLGGAQGPEVGFPPIPLHRPDGRPNHTNVAAFVALEGRTINIPDAYAAAGFDFEGTRLFDRAHGYRTRSILTIPLHNHEREVIGVLQLVNARREGEKVPFSRMARRLAESLASQAAVFLSQRQLIRAQKELFEAFIQVLAKAIDRKSKHTSGHCQRVPELTLMLAEAAHQASEGPLAEFRMTPEERYELEIASWMHDCGKVTTPEHIIDKATKLEAHFDRIELVDHRIEILRRDRIIQALADERPPGTLAQALDELEHWRERLHRCNRGTEFMPDEEQAWVKEVATQAAWVDATGRERPLLTKDEVRNLTIPRGTLTDEERQQVRDHILATIEMLESLPYPRYLQRVPALAGAHHERIDGKGYPRGLQGEDFLPGARMMAIADVFEALTAPDRPYKKPMPLSQALEILGRMTLEGHFDPDLFDLFIRRGLYLDYARRHLLPEQIDEVDLAAIPGYQP